MVRENSSAVGLGSLSLSLDTNSGGLNPSTAPKFDMEPIETLKVTLH